nr:MAG TPA: alpha-aminoadipate carrier protein [Caudoviricetes sp.]
MKRELRDCRTIGFRRSNIGRTSNVYMIRECKNCHAILEFPSDEVSTEVNFETYLEYIICPNCLNKVEVLRHESK